jgi:membrane protein DedA with SNARE-associated domain
MVAVWNDVLALVHGHPLPTLGLVFLLAFGESLAFISLLLPATLLLLGGGGVFGAAGLDFWPLWGAAAAGAVGGDWLSYFLGFRYRDAIGRMWPLSRHPALLARGHRAVQRWGIVAVFAGRFWGPLRCVMPLVAGICGMPALPFQLANVTSALLWAATVLGPGWALAWLR